MFEQIIRWLHLNQITWRSAADIVVLAVLVYQLLLLIRGTRAVQMLLGILSLAFFYFLTGPEHLLELPAVHRVLGAALFFIPFVVVVLFQNHIRRVLASFGSNPLRTLARTIEGPERPERIIDEVVVAVTSLASRRHGALIVFEREQGLRAFIETGIALDALVSYDLLTAIFLPGSVLEDGTMLAGSPLHDGAVIISEGRIRACCCYLPLTSGASLKRKFGSRHRAAIGISDETDAVAVVVSEERGTISLARDGVLEEDLDAHELAESLKSLLLPPRPLLPGFRRQPGSPGRPHRDHPLAAPPRAAEGPAADAPGAGSSEEPAARENL